MFCGVFGVGIAWLSLCFRVLIYARKECLPIDVIYFDGEAIVVHTSCVRLEWSV